MKKLLFTLFFGLAFGALGQAQKAIRVASYNIENYILSPIQNRPLKTKLAQAKGVYVSFYSGSWLPSIVPVCWA